MTVATLTNRAVNVILRVSSNQNRKSGDTKCILGEGGNSGGNLDTTVVHHSKSLPASSKLFYIVVDGLCVGAGFVHTVKKLHYFAIRDQIPACTQLTSPKVLKSARCKLGVAHSALD